MRDCPLFGKLFPPTRLDICTVGPLLSLPSISKRSQLHSRAAHFYFSKVSVLVFTQLRQFDRLCPSFGELPQALFPLSPFSAITQTIQSSVVLTPTPSGFFPSQPFLPSSVQPVDEIWLPPLLKTFGVASRTAPGHFVIPFSFFFFRYSFPFRRFVEQPPANPVIFTLRLRGVA